MNEGNLFYDFLLGADDERVGGDFALGIAWSCTYVYIKVSDYTSVGAYIHSTRTELSGGVGLVAKTNFETRVYTLRAM